MKYVHGVIILCFGVVLLSAPSGFIGRVFVPEADIHDREN